MSHEQYGFCQSRQSPTPPDRRCRPPLVTNTSAATSAPGLVLMVVFTWGGCKGYWVNIVNTIQNIGRTIQVKDTGLAVPHHLAELGLHALVDAARGKRVAYVLHHLQQPGTELMIKETDGCFAWGQKQRNRYCTGHTRGLCTPSLAGARHRIND